MKTRKAIAALLVSAIAWSNVTGLAFAREWWNGDNSHHHNNRGGSFHGVISTSQSQSQSNQQTSGEDNSNNGNNQRGFHGVTLTNEDQGGQQTSIIPRQIRIHTAQMLSPGDQSTINNRIDKVPLVERLDFLLSVLWRVETLRTSIEASTRTPEQKTRLISLLDEIANIVQNRISSEIADQADQADDHTAPITSAFNVSEIATDSATISFASNENGKGYFVILPSGSTPLTAAQVKAGQNSSGQTAPISGSSAITVGMNLFSVSGLSPNTSYAVYFVAEDIFENLQGIVTSKSFTTLQTGTGWDTTPPVTTAVSLTGVTSTGAMLWVTSNEAGTLYTVVLQSGAVAPTVTQVKAWQDASGTLASLHATFTMGTGSNQFNLSGLSPSTNYVVYLVAQDTSGNLQSAVTSASLTTLSTGGGWVDTTAPVTSGFDIISIGTGSAVATITTNEAGTGHLVVLQSGATAPTAAQVKAWQDGSGSATSIHVSAAATIGLNQFNIASLSPNTGYVAYFVAEDTSGNLQSTVTSKAFTSLAVVTDTTPPTITATSLTGVVSTGAMLNLTSSEPGTIFSVALLSGATAPTIAQVKAWQDGAGLPATLHASFTAASGVNQFNLNGFAPATSYVLYFVAEDAVGNLETNTHSLSLTTAP